MLFFIEVSNRRAHLAGVSANPDGVRAAQQARNFAWELSERGTPVRFLTRDNDGRFGGAFDEVFRGEGIEVIRTAVEAPKANAIAERFVGTVRRECLDWLLIANRRHLQHEGGVKVGGMLQSGTARVPLGHGVDVESNPCMRVKLASVPNVPICRCF